MNANTNKTKTSPTERLREALVHKALLAWSKATPEKQAKALAMLRKEQAAKRYPLPAAISDLVETDIRDEAFELIAITKAIFAWAMEQKIQPFEGGVSDMDIGDMVTLSDMAIRKAQRILDLANAFESKVDSLEVRV